MAEMDIGLWYLLDADEHCLVLLTTPLHLPESPVYLLRGMYI
jgi:hypothetical protein